ncbi:MAG: 2-amino-4-hydroxy-6-hydroxymethyldihydropteridine diphosphokinase [Micavibrio aeruginosavorus]|uniref:2-amino-4-hydroxy-6-hydroxymethyldihydropteridine pyrophosphokinase n=1 Tax=Micavibrio aeruginosavorus TaxID=349221 RepID=A0A2W5FNA1_9BACT|nr:MAG: 2-amino-4-hydroxy-6-hydroxymethyldihydropteridine diphosphokinase [Micavibrio aeruginosavorus]
MILVAIGANLPSRFGTPEETIQAAIEALNEVDIMTVKTSRIWLTAPVPVSDQPWYRNAVVSVRTDHDAFQLLSALHKIEANFGRVRYERNEPRVLDLDLIAYDDEIIERPSLIVPHPRMHERAFVLMPLQDVAPDWIHPITKKKLPELITTIPPEQMAQTNDKPHE